MANRSFREPTERFNDGQTPRPFDALQLKSLKSVYSFGWFDPIAAGSAYSAAMNEAETLTDVAAAVAVYVATFADAPAVADAQAGTAAFLSALSDTSAVAESQAGLLNWLTESAM